jgi:poly-gamma-glutamate synthesis protein (capsule biosynthesis protein)
VEPQGLRALWRGSALAYPLADVTVLSLGEQDLLCALHEPASFLTGRDPDPNAPRFTRSYRWQEFGFVASRSEAAEQACRERYAALLGTKGAAAGRAGDDGT